MSVVFIQMHGFPGTGKSTLAKRLGHALPAVVIDKDVIASALMRAGAAFADTSATSFAVMYAQAERLLEDGHSVVFDSPCFWPIIEKRTRELAGAASARWLMVETRCSDELRDARLATRTRPESQTSARDPSPMRPGTYHPSCERLIVDTSETLDSIVERALSYLSDRAHKTASIKEREPNS